MSAELDLPKAAHDALMYGNPREAIRLTVAAELRRLAGAHWGKTSGGDDLCEVLDARADELDPQGGES